MIFWFNDTLKKALEMIELLKVQPEMYKQENNQKQEYPASISEIIKEQKDCEVLSSLSESDEQEYILNEQEKALTVAFNHPYINDTQIKNKKKLAQQQKNQQSQHKQQNYNRKQVKGEQKSYPTPEQSVTKNYEVDGINPQVVNNLFSKEKKEIKDDDYFSQFN